MAVFFVLISGIGGAEAFRAFLENNVSPDTAAFYAVVVLALLLGAFGLITLSVNVDL